MAQQFNCAASVQLDSVEICGGKTAPEVFVTSSSEAADDHDGHETGSEFPSSDLEGVGPDVDGEIFETSDSASDCEVGRKSKRARYNERKSDDATFLGLKVCRSSLARLLGVGASTLQKVRRGESAYTNNCREKLAQHPTFGFALRGETGKVWEQIIMFLWFIYQSAAEVLPTNWTTAKNRYAETPFPEDDPDVLDKHDERLRLINSICRTINTCTTDVEANLIGPGTFQGPRRSLMQSSRTDLFWEYKAYAESRQLEAASYGTFLRVANAVLKPGIRNGHLRFRKASEHAQCDICFSLRAKIRACKTETAKLESQRELQRHILWQWLDRQTYWSFRSMSQTYFSSILEENARQVIGFLGNIFEF